MRKCLALLGLAALAVLLATSASAANRGVTFTPIGFIENPGPYPASQVWDMNPEGTVFIVSPSFAGSYIALWTRESGWGELVGSASAASAELSSGGVLMSNGIYPGSNPAYIWPGTWMGTTDVWNPIPANAAYAPCGTSRISFYGMGGEGDYATGLTWSGCSIARAFKWDKATNTTIDLGSPNTKSTRGNAITADGSKVIGWGTALFGTRRGAAFENGTVTFLGDPMGQEPKICASGTKYCTANTADPVTGCPGEYVDDGTCANRGTCQNKGTCVSNVCVGGSNPGTTCTSNSQCRGACVGGTNPGTSCTSDSVCAGTCTGPNAGAVCTSNGTCPDTNVCLVNPDWNDDLFKGEAYDVTPDGRYATGRNFNYSTKWDSAFRSNPDGTFTELPPPETWPYLMDPYGGISNDGKVIAGVAGTRLTGTAPFVWIEGVGTLDFQLFLIAQGLDELYFWYLAQNNTVSADGTIIGGFGYNPDNVMEGYIVDISKLWVCHVPPGQPENARTLGIGIESAADHVAHGDFLGTCEFMNSGALSRAIETRQQLSQQYSSETMNPMTEGLKGQDVVAPWAPKNTTTRTVNRTSPDDDVRKSPTRRRD